MKRKTLRNILAVMLCVMLAVSMLALSVSAEETTYAASVGENKYATVAEAVAAANGQVVTLLADSDETVIASGDLYLDLNGYTLAGLDLEDGKLYGMDTTTDDYTCADGYGKIVDFTGAYAVYHQVDVNGNPQRYLTVDEDEGISFHRFYLAITHKSLAPATQGVGYKALFCGDHVVKQQMDPEQAFGYTLQLDGYAPIQRWKGADEFVAEKTLTLRVNNYDEVNYGETQLKASVQIQLANGTIISSTEQSSSLKEMVADVNSDVAAYTEEQINSVKAWVLSSKTMQTWAVRNILTPEIHFDMNTNQNLVLENTGFTGTLQSVAIKGMDVTLGNATMANGVLTVPAASFKQDTMPSGRLTLVVTTDSDVIEITGEFTWVIQDWAGFAYMEKHLVSDGEAYTGSLALGFDLDLAGKKLQNFMWKNGTVFNGTFDGRNHTISNYTSSASTSAIFKELGENGVVKNLKLTNVDIATYAGGIAYYAKGTIENVYVQGMISRDGLNAGSELANFGCGLLAGQYYKTAKIENCIVEVTSFADGLYLGSAYGKLRNGVSADIFNYCNAVGANGNTYVELVEDVWTKQSFSLMSTNVDFATMAELWKDSIAAELAESLGMENPYAPKDMILENSFDMNTAADLVVADTNLTGSLQSVTVSGTDITLNATLVNGTLTIPAASFKQDTMPSGNLTLVVTTDSEQISISGEFIWVIKDWGGLAYMEKHLTANGTTYTGSLALGANISASGKNLNNFVMFKKDNAFNGTFDGRNYTISDLTPKNTTALFGDLESQGVIKNLKMTNVTISTYAGGVAYYAKGTIENVYVQGTITADGMSASSNLTNFGCGLLASQYYNTAKISNCIVEVTSIANGLRLGTAYGKLRGGVSENIFSNCFAVNADNCTFVESANFAKLSFTAGGTNANFANVNALWTNEVAAALAAGFGFENPNVAKDMVLESAFDMNTAADLVVENTHLTGTLQSVAISGTELTLANATLVNGTLTVPAASFKIDSADGANMPSGNLTLVVTTDSEQISISGEFIWVIKDWAGLAYMERHMVSNGTSYTGSLALGADLNIAGKTPKNFMWKTVKIFNGTFDGRNHTISNYNAASTTYGLFVELGENSVVKNLKMTNVTVSTYAGGLAYYAKGTIENVYVHGTITKDGMGAGSNLANFGCGLLAGQYYNTAKVNNCIVEVSSIASGLRLGTAFGKLRGGVSENIFSNCFAINADNCTFIESAKFAKLSFTAGGTNANFDSMDSLRTNEAAAALAKIFGLITE